MVKLIHSPIASLDGDVEDEQGKFDWAAPDDEVHAFVNEFERPIGTYLYGRRMYETMVFSETVSGGADQPAVIRDFAEIWRAAEKIVVSRTLQTVASARTHIERTFDPDAVRRLKEAAGADITIGGAELAGQASPRAWSTSYTCSSGRSLLVAASAPCSTTSASRSRSWTSAGSETASFTSTTVFATDRRR
jgi:dihydrofolate reductase